MKRIELLSPAGSFESLTAAVQGGADSVYFGVEQLNMRARSGNNFVLNDLTEIQQICTTRKVKTYLTLNTVMYDHDISLMKKIVNAAKENHVTAVIACDHAVLDYARSLKMPVHISTQANVSNVESVSFFSQFADAVVLARELSLSQVEYIVKQVQKRNITGPSGKPVKIEIFAHGALCMAISGKCYLSLHSANSSANRGACVQNCRRSYVVKDKEDETEFEIDNEYIMSSKDLCTIDFFDKIIHAGVSIAKIEGRGRSADYVFTTTRCYRQAIDSYYDGTFYDKAPEDWKRELATVYNRDFWGGYYLGKKMGEWSDAYGSKASTRKIYVGKGLKYFDRKKVGEFKLETSTLDVGNDILVVGPRTGIVRGKITELRKQDCAVSSVTKGDIFSFRLNEKIRPADKLYKVVEGP